ncbi:hypothetical protein DFH09DRAFT_1077007 [Mycena vulgaris]|nr:hypothetical protein DFH09DRAFT_1077007 [Mycena vulgaris]
MPTNNISTRTCLQARICTISLPHDPAVSTDPKAQFRRRVVLPEAPPAERSTKAAPAGAPPANARQGALQGPAPCVSSTAPMLHPTPRVLPNATGNHSRPVLPIHPARETPKKEFGFRDMPPKGFEPPLPTKSLGFSLGKVLFHDGCSSEVGDLPWFTVVYLPANVPCQIRMIEDDSRPWRGESPWIVYCREDPRRTGT